MGREKIIFILKPEEGQFKKGNLYLTHEHNCRYPKQDTGKIILNEKSLTKMHTYHMIPFIENC